MTLDYPDWTRLIQLIGSNIMMPIDIQGAYIMMPVDIQAQYVTLDIDIIAQTVGNIGIDIKAATVDKINVDITTQTIANLTIDINAQHVGMYLKPDWEVKEGHGKAWNVSGANKATDATITQAYTPDGVTLYINQVSAMMFGYADEDKDKDQVFELVIAGIYAGGNGGCQFVLPNPIKVISGVEANMTMYNRANHACNMRLSVRGYEI